MVGIVLNYLSKCKTGNFVHPFFQTDVFFSQHTADLVKLAAKDCGLITEFSFAETEMNSTRWFTLEAAIVILLLSACTLPVDELAPSSDANGSIWVLLPDSATSARWETDDRRYFEEAFREYGVDFTIVNAEGDARTQQTQAEQAITAGAKVLLLVNLNSGSGAAIVAMAREAGIAPIDYNRLTVQRGRARTCTSALTTGQSGA